MTDHIKSESIVELIPPTKLRVVTFYSGERVILVEVPSMTTSIHLTRAQAEALATALRGS